ncbi:hypothetical protein [Helcobacillus massiliensis]
MPTPVVVALTTVTCSGGGALREAVSQVRPRAASISPSVGPS